MIRIVARIALVVVLAPALSVTAEQRQLDVQLRETLLIGDRDAPEYHFSDIRAVVVDRNGDIYVADQKRADVRRYSSKGDFVEILGSRGKGPGEFSEVYALGLTSGDTLVVADRMNARFTKYSTNDGGYSTVSFQGPFMISPHRILEFRNQVLMVYTAISARNQESGAVTFGDNYLHLYDKALATVLSSFGERGDLYDQTVPLLRALSARTAGYWATICGSAVLVLPGVYDFSLAKYEPKGELWTTTLLHSDPTRGRAYRVMDERSFSDAVEAYEARGRTDILINHNSSSSGRHFASIRRRSLAASCLPSNQVLHFYVEHFDRDAHLYAELFGPDGTFVARDEVEVEWAPGQLTRLSIPWVDERGNLYAEVTEDGIPTLRRLKVEWRLRD